MRLMNAVFRHKKRKLLNQDALWPHVDDSGEWVVRVIGSDPDVTFAVKQASVYGAISTRLYSARYEVVYGASELRIIRCPGKYVHLL